MIYETIPEIQRSSMNSVVLYLKVLGIHNVIDFEYFERPSHEQLTEVSIDIALCYIIYKY